MSFLSRVVNSELAAPGEPDGGIGVGARRVTGKEERRRIGSSLLERCSNPGCRSGWLHVWRRGSAPVFEGGWSCSFECTRQLMTAAVRREQEGRNSQSILHHHRIPLGLLMLEQGWITASQLRCALDGQRSAGRGRIGEWLVRQGAADEQRVTRALALQWSCPVLPVDAESVGLSTMMPRLFVDAFGVLPLRFGAGRVLYLGFEEGLDRGLTLAMERMTALRVESGVVQGSIFARVHERLLAAEFPHAELVEAASEAAAAYTLAKLIEQSRPLASRLARVHDCLWLRMWMSLPEDGVPAADGVYDVICTIAGN